MVDQKQSCLENLIRIKASIVYQGKTVIGRIDYLYVYEKDSKLSLGNKIKQDDGIVFMRLNGVARLKQ